MSPDEKNVAMMDAAELEAHIAKVKEQHKLLVRSLTALLKVRQLEEAQQ